MRAKDVVGNTSAESDPLVTTPPPPDTQAPSVPANLRTTSLTPTSLTLAWDASTDNDSGVAGYDVLRNGSLIGSTAGLSLPDTGLTPNTDVQLHGAGQGQQGQRLGRVAPRSS